MRKLLLITVILLASCTDNTCEQEVEASNNYFYELMEKYSNDHQTVRELEKDRRRAEARILRDCK